MRGYTLFSLIYCLGNAWFIGQVAAQDVDVAANSAADELRSELGSQWDLISTGIVSAEIEFTSCTVLFDVGEFPPHYKGPKHPKPTITPEAVVELFDRYDLIAHPEQRDEFMAEVLGGQSTPGSPWLDGRRLLIKGQRIRDQSSEGTSVLDAETFIDVDSLNRQVSVNQRGRYALGHYKLADFYQCSSHPAEILKTWNLTERPAEGLIELRPPADEVDAAGTFALVESSTGVPVQWRGVIKGIIRGDHLNRQIVTLPSGIPFPMCSAKVVYVNDQLAQLRMQLVTSVRLNEPVADAEFVVTAAVGDKFFDRRREPPYGRRLDQPVDDVLVYSNALAAVTTPAEARTAGVSRWQVLLVVNGLVFLAIGVFLWRRSKDPKRVLNP